MEKLVIISRQQRVNYSLIALLSVLFPECGIQTVFLDTEGCDAFADNSSREYSANEEKEGQS